MFRFEKQKIGRKHIHVVMDGFLTVPEVADSSRQEQKIAEDMDYRTGEFTLLIDTASIVIQSQEVVAAFQSILQNHRLKASRIAVVRGSTLTRLQTQRILNGRNNAAIFDNLADAQSWLKIRKAPKLACRGTRDLAAAETNDMGPMFPPAPFPSGRFGLSGRL